MSTYQGPNVQVTQKFVTTPPAVAVENLPPAITGTAYDVYAKEFLSEAYGIVDREALWGVDDVIWDNTVIGNRLYDFYPVKVYGQTAFGDIELSPVKSATGATITKDQTYAIPNTEKIVGNCQAIIPFYLKTLTAGDVKILATDLSTVIATGASFTTAKLKAGQSVFAGDLASPGSFVQLGTVSAVGSDETKIKLTSAYASTVSFDTIIVGASDSSVTLRNRPNCLYDSTADFIAARVKVGDIVTLSSLSLSAEVTATITSIVNKNMIKFNTVVPTTGREDWDFYSYKTSIAEPGSTINVSTYNLYRFVGFSQNYGFQAIGSGIHPTGTTPTTIKITLAQSAPLLSKGDYIAMTTTNVSSTATNFYLIDTVSVDATYQIYTTLEAVLDQAGSPYTAASFAHAWHPLRTSNVVADFRAVRSEEHMVAKRIQSNQDIIAAWCKDDSISPYNELAYAASIALASSGGQILYGVNVDSKSSNLSAEYAEALELLKIQDVYTHVFCTTDGGVNALMAPYCDEQSAPYEAHERIGIICYDQEDIYEQASDTGVTTSSGVITVVGTVNLATAGVTTGDIVRIYNSSGVLQATVNVIDTPEAGSPYVCNTDGDDAYSSATMTFKFLSNRAADQSIKIGNLGIGNRRVSIVWPGWFQGDIGTSTVMLPPYYITSAIAGMDSLNNPSQSFTNRNFSIPGVSNIKLDTNYYFRKLELDEIGGGGVDIMIQDGTISQQIRSRHDLTSNMDAVEYRERSITKQADVAAKTLRSAINPYVGKYNITQSLLNFINQVCSIVSVKLTKDGIIAAMTTQAVERDANIADKININVTVTVFVAGNYYDITMLIVSR